MKAKELAEILMQHPDWDVIKSADDEGNGYQVVGGWSDEYRYPDGEYHIEEIFPVIGTDAAGNQHEEDCATDEHKECFVLW